MGAIFVLAILGNSPTWVLRSTISNKKFCIVKYFEYTRLTADSSNIEVCGSGGMMANIRFCKY